MIGSLRGLVVDLAARSDHIGELVIEVAGVGYRVVVPAPVLGGFAGLGAQVFVHVHTHVREDAIVLYGFPTKEERDCFELLIGAHGVGPGVGVTLLSVHSPAALRRAVAGEDLDALMLVPGIGKKTAARLVIELKSRLGEGADSGPSVVGRQTGEDQAEAATRNELRAALAALGYSADEIRQTLLDLPAEGNVEDLLRQALRGLAVSR